MVDDLTAGHSERDAAPVEVGEHDPREARQGFGEGESDLQVRVTVKRSAKELYLTMR